QPSFEARERTIAKALEDFEAKKDLVRLQGWTGGARHRQRNLPGRPLMTPSARAAFVTAFALLLAVPAAWIGYETLVQRPPGGAPPQPAERTAQALPPAPPQAEPSAGATKAERTAQAPYPTPSGVAPRPAPLARDAHAKRRLAR